MDFVIVFIIIILWFKHELVNQIMHDNILGCETNILLNVVSKESSAVVVELWKVMLYLLKFRIIECPFAVFKHPHQNVLYSQLLIRENLESSDIMNPVLKNHVFLRHEMLDFSQIPKQESFIACIENERVIRSADNHVSRVIIRCKAFGFIAEKPVVNGYYNKDKNNKRTNHDSIQKPDFLLRRHWIDFTHRFNITGYPVKHASDADKSEQDIHHLRGDHKRRHDNLKVFQRRVKYVTGWIEQNGNHEQCIANKCYRCDMNLSLERHESKEKYKHKREVIIPKDFQILLKNHRSGCERLARTHCLILVN